MSIEKYKEKWNNKPLCTDITGDYKLIGKQYFPTKKRKMVKTKNVFTIAFAEKPNTLFINHTDYFPLQVEYNYSNNNNVIIFEYNCSQYSIDLPLNEIITLSQE